MASLKFKHCDLPYDCPALCDNMREVQDQNTGKWVTLCTEEKDGKCPFSVESEYNNDKATITHESEEEST